MGTVGAWGWSRGGLVLALGARVGGALLLVSTAACTSAVSIPVAEAPRLSVDAPPEGSPRTVRTTDGEIVEVPRRFSLVVVPRDRKAEVMTYGSPMKIRLSPAPGVSGGQLTVEDGLDPASPACQQAPWGACPPTDKPQRRWSYDVRDIKDVQLRVGSPGKTAGASVGVFLGVAAVAAVVTTVVFAVGMTGMR